MEEMKMARSRKRRAFNDDEFNSLMSTIAEDIGSEKKAFMFYVFFYLLSQTGLRRNEAIKLNLDKESKGNYLDLDEKKILIRAENCKTKRDEFVVLSNDLVYLLQYYIRHYNYSFREGYIFPGTRRGRAFIAPITINHRFSLYLKRAGLNKILFEDKRGARQQVLRVHALRAYFCTQLLLKTKSMNPQPTMAELCTLTRHSSPATLHHYYIDLNIEETQRNLVNAAFN